MCFMRIDKGNYQRHNDQPIIDAVASDFALGVEAEGH